MKIVAGEQAVDEQRGGLLQRDQPDDLAVSRQADEAVDLAGHADQRVHLLAVGGARELERDGEAEARNEREGVGRVDRERCQQRKHVAEEVVLDPGSLRLGDLLALDQNDALVGQRAAQVAPDRLLVGGQLRDGPVDKRELLGRRQAVGAAFGNALAHLGLDAGDADHEELVEIIR
ncbi:hypothetical protein ACVW1A_006193 [Bradyrhizobium sp. LB1.3]